MLKVKQNKIISSELCWDLCRLNSSQLQCERVGEDILIILTEAHVKVLTNLDAVVMFE